MYSIFTLFDASGYITFHLTHGVFKKFKILFIGKNLSELRLYSNMYLRWALNKGVIIDRWVVISHVISLNISTLSVEYEQESWANTPNTGDSSVYSFYGWTKIRRNRPLLKRRVTLRLNMTLKGYVYCQHLYTVRWGNGSATTGRNFVAEFIRFKLIFIHKNNIFAFWATPWGVRGNVRTSSIARWKVRGRLPIRDNWTFSLALTVETL